VAVDVATQERSGLKVGAYACWLSLLMLPAGLMVIGGGPCAGPRDATGSLILILIGFVGIAATTYGCVRIAPGFRAAAVSERILGVLSLLSALLVFAGSMFYLMIGAVSLQAYWHVYARTR
jgi:hypothetical protein